MGKNHRDQRYRKAFHGLKSEIHGIKSKIDELAANVLQLGVNMAEQNVRNNYALDAIKIMMDLRF